MRLIHNHLAEKDPWTAIGVAWGQRGSIVAGWLSRANCQQPTDLFRRRQAKRGTPDECPTGGVWLLTMLPLALQAGAIGLSDGGHSPLYSRALGTVILSVSNVSAITRSGEVR